MKILKFGGSSVGTPERINSVIKILQDYVKNGEKFSVVFSAFQGVTDKLILLCNQAVIRNKAYTNIFNELKNQHIKFAKQLISNDKLSLNRVEDLFSELYQIVQGVYLLKELTPRTLDYTMSFGERLSCFIISEAMKIKGINCEFLDARKLVFTDKNFGAARVNFELTNINIKEYFKNKNSIQVITGFISSTEDNETTTLGRGGSDYTASIFGAALGVDEIEIWTDVDGILTADPRKVADAFSLKAVTFEEAMELSHFGAKVIHPPTMVPALKNKIKIRIKNTFNPSFRGTVIIERQEKIPFNVKGISSIDDISILRITGGGLIGGFDILHRIFKVLAEKNINVILITQGSSEYSLCLAVMPKQTKIAKYAIEQELRNEIRDNQIKEVLIENDLSIIAVVGEDMRHTIGIAGKIFQTMGENGVNLVAIAQGSSELNISMVIARKDLEKALNVLHTKIFKPLKIECNLFLAGPGLIGSNVLKILEKEIEKYPEQTNIKFKLIGLADIKGYLFDNKGINISKWKSSIAKNAAPKNDKKFIDEIIKFDLPNSIFLDCTAGKDYVPYYEKLLSSNISVVTPNKIANTSSYELFEKLRNVTKNKKSEFRYSANVGAGTPMISIIQDLVKMGDRIHKIEGIFSGTLSYIFNNLKKGKKFSEIVREAKVKGFTEPDPRDDLSGLDMARKLLILIREAGYKLELKDIKVENLVPKEARKVNSVEEFFKILKKYDNQIEQRRLKILKKGKVLCYIATFENGEARLRIEEIASEHPFYNLSGNDNIVAYTTDYYNENPLTIRGRGAGAEFTAHSVFSDVLRILKK